MKTKNADNNKMNEQKNTPDYYPHDSSQVLAWHERRHEAVHEILTKEGIKGSLTLLLEERVQHLASLRLVAIAEVQRLTYERDDARALCDEASRQRDGWRTNAERLQNLSDELKNELNHALAELHALRANTMPEPSRLEIAARIMQGWAAAKVMDLSCLQIAALRHADALIAAAKEAQP